ncbi:hypothetical protein PsorP6_015556 [Peronosclerospora sorghi]|uniref:Uncharacterized protein n=1 Tax=Peronosclerospora sorghi TaxID=230839 RepID=A0ACC0WP61_9STRA|nr:hypothetical protein PsorP6_015556 [Peronosclerospora sorghi]
MRSSPARCWWTIKYYGHDSAASPSGRIKSIMLKQGKPQKVVIGNHVQVGVEGIFQDPLTRHFPNLSTRRTPNHHQVCYVFIPLDIGNRSPQSALYVTLKSADLELLQHSSIWLTFDWQVIGNGTRVRWRVV